MSDSLGRPVVGVGVAVVEGDRILLVKRGRDPGKGKWAVPGGKPRFGEPLRQAARREVKEETGLVVDIGEVIWAGDSIGPGQPPAWHFALVDFLGNAEGGDLKAGDDASDVRWVNLTDAEDLDLTPTMYGLLAVIRSRDEPREA